MLTPTYLLLQVFGRSYILGKVNFREIYEDIQIVRENLVKIPSKKLSVWIVLNDYIKLDPLFAMAIQCEKKLYRF